MAKPLSPGPQITRRAFAAVKWLLFWMMAQIGVAGAWSDYSFPAESENFFQPLPTGGTILTKSWQGNLLSGTGLASIPAPLNALTVGSQYRMAVLAPPGAARTSINFGYTQTVVFKLGAYSQKQEFYGVSSPPQPDTDLQSSSAIVSLRLYPIGSHFTENTESCAKTTYFVLDGSDAPGSPVVLSVDLFMQFTNPKAYQTWLDAGRPVCGQTVSPTTTVFKVTAPASISAGQSFLLTTSGSLQACTP